MKCKKIASVLCILLVLCFVLSGCKNAEQKSESARIFTDSCGREVGLPEQINTVVPLGKAAQMLVYSVAPEKLLSLASPVSEAEREFMPDCISLPVTGQFYGGGSTVNFEEMIGASPDLIVDVGEKKATIREDLDELEKMTSIPCVFIELDLENMDETCRMLGELLGAEENAGKCAGYIEKAYGILGSAEKEPHTILYARGENGTEVVGKGSVHAQTLDFLSLENVAVFEEVSAKGGNEVSPEQILNWDPEFILFTDDTDVKSITQSEIWTRLRAIENENYATIPSVPINWLDNPPSVQRILGMLWLAKTVYPDEYDFDLYDMAEEYFDIFYHYEIAEQQLDTILNPYGALLCTFF